MSAMRWIGGIGLALVVAGLFLARQENTKSERSFPAGGAVSVGSLEDEWVFQLAANPNRLNQMAPFWVPMSEANPLGVLQQLGMKIPAGSAKRVAWLRAQLEVGRVLLLAWTAASDLLRDYTETRLLEGVADPTFRRALTTLRAMVCVENGELDCVRWLSAQDGSKDPLTTFLFRLDTRALPEGLEADAYATAAIRRWFSVAPEFKRALEQSAIFEESAGGVTFVEGLERWQMADVPPAPARWSAWFGFKEPHFGVSFLEGADRVSLRFYDPILYGALSVLVLDELMREAGTQPVERWLKLEAQRLLGTSQSSAQWCALSEDWQIDSGDLIDESWSAAVLFSDWESLAAVKRHLELRCRPMAGKEPCPSGEDAARAHLETVRRWARARYDALAARWPGGEAASTAIRLRFYAGPARRRFLGPFLGEQAGCSDRDIHDGLMFWQGERVGGTRWRDDAAVIRWVQAERSLVCRGEAQEALGQLEHRQPLFRPLYELLRFAGGFFKRRCDATGGVIGE